LTSLLPYCGGKQGFFFQGSLQKPLHGVPGALALHGARAITVANCTFAHLGLSGVVSDFGSQDILITGNRFADLSGSAISVGNVSAPILAPADQDANMTLSENFIRDTGAEYSGCAGIFAGYVAATDIVHNDIADTSNGAVCLGWGWGATNSMSKNRVVYNRIFRSNTVLYDCGSVYTLSAQPGSEVAFNFIADQVCVTCGRRPFLRSPGCSRDMVTRLTRVPWLRERDDAQCLLNYFRLQQWLHYRRLHC